MFKSQILCQWLCLFLLAQLMHVSRGDVGTVSHYSPPYLPTACYGYDFSQFPTTNLFAAAGDGIWDNGAACGRQYWVRCISAAKPKSCNPNKIIQVRIVDRAKSSHSRSSKQGTTMVLSTTAFGSIADPSAPFLNVEYKMV